jgi:uncharacterized protein (DUF58 family)
MELDDLIKTVQKIDLMDKTISRQKKAGSRTGSLKGHGLSFDSIRKYEIGDDTKNINWNVTARFRDTYINTFVEDKEQVVWILIDTSGSTVFGSKFKSKFDLEIEIGATLAYSALKNNDSVGVIFFSNKIEKLIQPSKGMKNFWHIAKEMVNIKPCHKTINIDIALQYLMKIGSRSSLIFILSDFIGENYNSYVKIIEQNHKLIAIKVYDEMDNHFPDVGWIKLKDSESAKERWVNTSSVGFKNNYRSQFEKKDQYFNKTFLTTPLNTLKISTGENVIEKLMQFIYTIR